LKAQAFARFFGTPTFLVSQTVIVSVWIAANILGVTKFHACPFILFKLRNRVADMGPARPSETLPGLTWRSVEACLYAHGKSVFQPIRSS
jgi:hypothetical protein